MIRAAPPFASSPTQMPSSPSFVQRQHPVGRQSAGIGGIVPIADEGLALAIQLEQPKFRSQSRWLPL